jgi:predicted HD superfamily hydrolase involved in NAD metabolism
MNNDNIYIKLLDKYIKNEKRKIHSISTAEFMKKHALKFGLDEQKSYKAGLLHDIGKYISDDDKLKLTESYSRRKIEKIRYLDFKKQNTFLLHGIASAEIVIKELAINDKELILAITHHTTGGAQIPELARYTFLCDFCEPLREYKESEIIRKILVKNQNFYKAYYYSYSFLLEDLIKRKSEICLESIEGYNEALSLYIKNKSKDKII